ncbi:DUF4254 domain-containing protein [Nocardia terpenica]|uniref:DUF4254 domain-containing protein n=1 Tax=Nocardia terpenica TaxID=455432 RepID=A0A291RJY5_9NOCA|nr:DUF4254 domain-containing protein [Nocardia terpenica]ATL67412.1 hypothetical protein CRH09_15605 [Nocardia terpenica]
MTESSPHREPAPTGRRYGVVTVRFDLRGWRLVAGIGVSRPRTRDRATSAPVVRVTRARQTQFTTTRADIPSAAEVVAACATRVVRSDDVVLHAVHRLARMACDDHAHATGHDDDPEELAVTHDELLELIDRVTQQRLPQHPDPGAAVHTETLAPVISRLVTLAVTRAQLTQPPPDPEPDRFVEELNTALADLMSAYDQLLADMAAGRRRLPRYQTASAD